jgi:hypothetical protein
VCYCLASVTQVVHSVHMCGIPVIKWGTFICLRNLLYNSGSHILAPLVLVRPKARNHLSFIHSFIHSYNYNLSSLIIVYVHFRYLVYLFFQPI